LYQKNVFRDFKIFAKKHFFGGKNIWALSYARVMHKIAPSFDTLCGNFEEFFSTLIRGSATNFGG
jgi:hypothetical protein